MNLFISAKSDFSFTDCTNIALVNNYRINYLATLDTEFRKIRGIKIVP